MDASSSSLPPNVLTQNGPYIILNVQTVPTLIFDLNLEIGEALECGCITATCPQRGLFIYVVSGESHALRASQVWSPHFHWDRAMPSHSDQSRMEKSSLKTNKNPIYRYAPNRCVAFAAFPVFLTV